MKPITLDIIVGQENIRHLFGGRHWITVLKMINEEGYPITKVHGRWQCSRVQVEAWHRHLQEIKVYRPHKYPVKP